MKLDVVNLSARFALRAGLAVSVAMMTLSFCAPSGFAQTSKNPKNKVETKAPPAMINDDSAAQELPRKNEPDRTRFPPSLTAEEREKRLKAEELDKSLTAEERAVANEADTQSDGTPGNTTGEEPARNLDEMDKTASTDPNELEQSALNRPDNTQQEAFSPYPSGRDWQGYHPSEEDPYAPRGIGLGSFVLYPELVTQGVHNDNLFLDRNNQQSDQAIELRPTLLMESNWNRHALSGAFRGTFNWHDEFGSEDEKDYAVELRGRLDLTTRTNLEGEASYDITQEGRGSLDFPGGAAERTDVETYRAGGGVNHRFNRLSVSIKGAVEEVEYGDTALIGGGLQTNADREYNEYGGILRLSYDFRPGFAIFTEGELGARDYKTRFDDEGFQRSSERYALRGGVLIDLSPKLRGEFAVGHAAQEADDPRLSQIDGVIVDALLEWRPHESTTVTLTATSEIEETTFSSAAGIFERFYAAEIRHELRRHLILTAGLNYMTEDYKGIATKQNTLGVELGAEYILSRRAAILGSYAHTKSDGDGDAQIYRENEVRLGVRLRP